jgi:hypothetical protein
MFTRKLIMIDPHLMEKVVKNPRPPTSSGALEIVVLVGTMALSNSISELKLG